MKKEGLGMGNIEWKEVKLRDISLKITKGTTPTSLGFPFVETGINYIKVEALTFDGTINPSKFAFISEEANEKLKRSIIQEGDILFSMAGMVLGKTAVVKKEYLPANTNQALAIIRLDFEKAIPKFVDYFIRQNSFFNYVNTSTGQSAQPNINLEEIGNLVIKLPSKQIQQTIASILSSLDDKIELNRQTNQTLEAIAQTLFKEMCVPKSEVFPEGWEVVQLNKVLEIKYGKDHKHLENGSIPLYGSGGIMRFVNKALYEKESILIPRKGTLSNLFYINKPFWSVDTMFYTKIKDRTYSKFLFLLLKSMNLAAMNVGSAVPSLTTEILNRLEIIIPPMSILKSFDIRVTPFFKMLEMIEEENKTLIIIRDSLLPKLMRGEIKV